MGFESYLKEINNAYQRGDATEHTHRPALKGLIESLGNKITATNEPRRQKCGAPDYIVSRGKKGMDQTIGYVEAKDIGTNLTQAAKSEQIKKRYLPSLNNFILTDYVEFHWYVSGEKQLTARLAEESAGKFKVTDEGEEKVGQLLESFLSQEPEKIKGAKELAGKMAYKAQMMRDIIKETFLQEKETGSLHGQFEAFRDVLLHDLTEEQFADMYAQTICYGLFSARCHIDDMTIFGKDQYAAFHGMDDRAKELTREHAAYLLPKTNPFFRDIFGDIAGPKLDDRIVWLVDDLVELLRQADMGVILRDFARGKKRKDPVVHFYETFLGEYDSKLKKSRGVYYTPDEVVSYIVRSVDILLKEKFGLRRGLADDAKIKGEDVHRLLILDPAVGTGTFLFEVIEQIHEKFRRQKGAWSGYVKDHLLPRLFGFELMMAPYAVAHMKLGLQLAETGYDFSSDERLRIYLTNTLEEAEKNIQKKFQFANYLSQEAMAANKIKKDLPIMVITGNPPYSGISANQGEWINNLINVYRKVDGKPLGEKKVWIKNDYVKFIRFGQWRIEQTGTGILAFITDHSYLDSPTFRGMRRNLMKTFDDIYILNLHGNSKRRETCPDGSEDKNVFDIRQGTAISLFVKNSNHSDCRVHYADLWGSRNHKYTTLLETDIDHTDLVEIIPIKPFYEFVPVNKKKKTEYDKGWKMADIFTVGSNGVQTSRDAIVVGVSKSELIGRFEWIRDPRTQNSEIHRQFFTEDKSFWKLSCARSLLNKETDWKINIQPYLYRPFDHNWLFTSEYFVHRPRLEVMRHLNQPNLAMCIGRAGLVVRGSWNLLFCANRICDHNLFYRGSSMNFPLYLYPELGVLTEDRNWPVGKGGRVPNLDKGFVDELAGKVKLEFLSDGVGDLKKTFGPEDIFHYIYGVFHSPEYRRRYGEFLKIDFPRVPMTGSKVLFGKLCKTGEKLVKGHLLEAEILEDQNKWPAFDIEGDNVVEKGYPKYVAHAVKPGEGRVYINKKQYFEGVRPNVWEFHVGGYQVCEKWLKDRRGRKLDYEDMCHYRKMVVALGETIKLMDEVDKVIEANGGWPMK